MFRLEPVHTSSSPQAAEARMLFAEYSHLLSATQACGTHFHPQRFEEEAARLPYPYTDHNGELLLVSLLASPKASLLPSLQIAALPSGEENSTGPLLAAACIAFRATSLDPLTCEIKRLFVLPAYRNRGLARSLVAEVLSRARARRFTRAILDTDLLHMPGALPLYTSFGFREYGTRDGNIAFFEVPLLPARP